MGREDSYDKKIRAIRWMSIILFLSAITMFVLTIVIMVMQIMGQLEGEYVDLAETYLDAGSLIGNIDIFVHTTTSLLLIVTCVGAGSTGIAVSVKDDFSHNLSVKTSFMGLCMMTFVAALLYMIGTGAVYFTLLSRYIKDFGDLRREAEWVYISYILVIVYIMIAFAVSILAIVGYFLTFTFRPASTDSNNPGGKYQPSSRKDRGDDYYSDYVTDRMYPTQTPVYPYRHAVTKGNYATYY